MELKKQGIAIGNIIYFREENQMWNTGFAKYLQEILEAFMGEISYQWKNGETSVELKLIDQGEEILIKLSENQVVREETLGYEELYQVLVPDNKLDYLYLFQDILDEINELDSKEIVVKGYVDDLLQKMSGTFMKRIEEMNLVGEDFEEDTEVECEPTFTPVPSVKFIENGIEYEQLALF